MRQGLPQLAMAQCSFHYAMAHSATQTAMEQGSLHATGQGPNK